MENVKFVYGKEERFKRFAKDLGKKKEKVLILTHTDCDGIVSGKVLGHVVRYDKIMFVDYNALNMDLVGELKRKGFDKVIISDLSINDWGFIKGLEEFSEILIVDHHPSDVDFNSEKTVFMNSEGYCAAYLCYYLFFEILGLSKMETIDWLVVCASLADHQFEENRDWMSKVYGKYHEKFLISKYKEGVFWIFQDIISKALVYFSKDIGKVFYYLGEEFADLGDLEKYAKEVSEEVEIFFKKFKKDRREIEDGWFWEFEGSKFGIKSLLINKISLDYYPEKTIIVGVEKGKYYSISARRQDKKVDVGKLCERLVEGFSESSGGGHAAAAAAFVLKKDEKEFKKRIESMISRVNNR